LVLIPQVKIWHDLGTLTVSCSEPPDLILCFDTTSTPSGDTKYQPSHTRSTGKTRLRYSPSDLYLQLETNTISCHDTKQTSSLRTRRNATLTHLVSDKVVHGTTELAMMCDALGIDAAGWTEGEMEAIRRLWLLRAEWKRYI